jgi:hypothetical protein
MWDKEECIYCDGTAHVLDQTSIDCIQEDLVLGLSKEEAFSNLFVRSRMSLNFR